MHLGDHMYFKPLIKKLHDSGMSVVVDSSPLMSFAFTAYTLKQRFDSAKTLFITRVELLAALERQFGSVEYFSIDTMSTNINLPISNYILNAFCRYYEMENIDLFITANDYLDFEVKS